MQNFLFTVHADVSVETRGVNISLSLHIHVQIKREEGRGSSPPEKSQNYRVFSNTDPDPLKYHNATKPDSMLVHHRHASETPFK